MPPRAFGALLLCIALLTGCTAQDGGAAALFAHQRGDAGAGEFPVVQPAGALHLGHRIGGVVARGDEHGGEQVFQGVVLRLDAGHRGAGFGEGQRLGADGDGAFQRGQSGRILRHKQLCQAGGRLQLILPQREPHGAAAGLGHQQGVGVVGILVEQAEQPGVQGVFLLPEGLRLQRPDQKRRARQDDSDKAAKARRPDAQAPAALSLGGLCFHAAS